MTLQRPSIQFADLSWALRFVELEEEIDALPWAGKRSCMGTGELEPQPGASHSSRQDDRDPAGIADFQRQPPQYRPDRATDSPAKALR